MTQLQFTTQLLDIINDLLGAGITSCNIHEARTYLDYLFDAYEEMDGVVNDKKKSFSMDGFFKDLTNMVNMPFGEYESECFADEQL